MKVYPEKKHDLCVISIENTVWRMILGRVHALKCKKKKKISCKSLQKSIEAMVMKEKRLPQITLSLFD